MHFPVKLFNMTIVVENCCRFSSLAYLSYTVVGSICIPYPTTNNILPIAAEEGKLHRKTETL